MKKMQFRQGDVLIRRVSALPEGEAKKRENGVIAYGEVTGHSHAVDVERAEVLEIERGVFLRVGPEGVSLVHQEHAPIFLPEGNYEATIQREYTPEAIRNVAD